MPSGFDAVVIVRADADVELGGMRLVERALFTMARAGARRLLCMGRRLPPPLRVPNDVPITWIGHDQVGLPAWTRDATPRVVGTDAATVVGVELVRALAGSGRDGILLAAGDGLVFRCDPAALPAVLAAAEAGTVRTLPEASTWEAPPGALLARADTPGARAAVERRLFGRLGRTGDGWFTRLVDRRISRALTRRLLPLGLTPNQITVGSILVGIAGGLLFATGGHGAAVAGASLFLLSTILDGCDGEIARLTFRESPLGARLDLIGDNLVHLVLFGGIALGLYTRTPDVHVAALGALLLTGVLLSMATVYWCLVHREPTRAQQMLFEAFASREFAYLLLGLTLVDKLAWFLWLAAGGTYVFVAGLLTLGLHRAPAAAQAPNG
jgi:phosphatidylglycerophosphate synthase